MGLASFEEGHTGCSSILNSARTHIETSPKTTTIFKGLSSSQRKSTVVEEVCRKEIEKVCGLTGEDSHFYQE